MLPDLINVPRDEKSWEIWSFANKNQIFLIRQAIFEQKGINLPEYILEPIPFNNFPEWLDRKAQSHEDFNSTLGLQSSDLRDLDPQNEQQLKSWIYVQYQELFTASSALGI